MSSPFNLQKATEASLQFMRRHGGRINVMKLIKLIYILDRVSIEKRGIPVVGGTYFSMQNGPVTSELLDLINAGELAGDDDSRWEKFISDRKNHEIAIRASAQLEQEFLSDYEIGLIDEIFAIHGGKSQWELRDWCPERGAEWTPLQNGRQNIAIEDIAKSVGYTEEAIARVSEETQETNLLAFAFARA